MGPRADGGKNLLGFGGSEYEDQVLRWLLDDLEQGVEALLADHVGLVDDEDAVAGLRGQIEGAVPQVAGVVDAPVAGGIEFGHVEVARATGAQRHTGVAHPARCRGRALLAVQ